MKFTLKALRINLGLNQKEAAKAIGVSNNTLVKWERNISYPNIIQIDKICKLYGCSMTDISFPDLDKNEEEG